MGRYFRFFLYFSLLWEGCAPRISSTLVSPILKYSALTAPIPLHLNVSITPSTFNTSGFPLVSCQIKSGSNNASSFPTYFSINPYTCVISGTPTSILSSTQFTIEAVNNGGFYVDSTVTLSAGPCDSTATPYGLGNGTSGNPYQICSATHLNNVANNLSSYFQLAYNLDLTTDSTLVPIGSSGTPFTGTFDGNNLILSNWTYSEPASNDIGLFSYVNGGIIKNLNLVNFTISGNDYTGTLGGEMYSAQVSNCSASGSLIAGTGTNGIGGLIGLAESGSTVSNCSSSVNVSGGGGREGVLVGNNNGGSITHSHATGNLSSTLTNGIFGGLVGDCAPCTVTTSYATGTLSLTGSGVQNVGGLIGSLSFGGSSVANSYSTGAVYSPLGGDVGGLVGIMQAGAAATNCFSSGLVTASGANVGGFSGLFNASTTTGSYWDSSAASGSSSGTVESTNYLQDPVNYSTNFSGWDFTNTWYPPSSGSTATYPTLR